jgi:hypothetical protein
MIVLLLFLILLCLLPKGFRNGLGWIIIVVMICFVRISRQPT